MTDVVRGSASSLSAALEYAALSGTFDPAAALRVALVVPQELSEAAEVASALSRMCDTNPDEGPDWVILGSKRQEVLSQLVETKSIRAALERRRAHDPDEASRDLMDAIEGRGDFAPTRLRNELMKPSDPRRVERIAAALERAGTIAPDNTLVLDARASLLEVERRTRRREMGERGFFGRERELAAMLHALHSTSGKGLGAVVVSGLPGIGKSALVEQTISKFAEGARTLTARLDFDRAGLDATSPTTLLMEVARQIVDRLGAGAGELRNARLASAGAGGREELRGVRRTALPRSLLDTLSRTLMKAERTLLVAVDTLEALEARGATHAEQLVTTLERLAESLGGRLRVLIAGRAPPRPDLLRRVGGLHVELDGLREEPARYLLSALGVDERDQQVVLRRAQGVPLALRLGAVIVRTGGSAALAKAGAEAREFTSALLYRILLSRIEDDTLRRLAHPGLILRRLSAEIVGEVLAPAAGLNLSEEEAQEAFDALSLQHWLVRPDPIDPTFVRHRNDMRSYLLPMLYDDEPALCAKIDAAAVRWFGRREDGESAVDALYHRLQQLRRSWSQPAIPADLALMLDPTDIAELPERARVAVRQAAGESSAAFGLRSFARTSEEADSSLFREVLRIIDVRDWSEGLRMTEGMRRTGMIDPSSKLADAVRALWWRAGNWSDAKWLLRERDRLGRDDADLIRIEPPLAAARVEIRGETGTLKEALEAIKAAQQIPPFAFDEQTASRGACAFRARAARLHWAPDRLPPKEPDPVAAAFGRWGWGSRGDWDDLIERATELQARSGVPASHAEAGTWQECELAASRTPYAPVVAAAIDRDERLSRACASAAVSLMQWRSAHRGDFEGGSRSDVAGDPLTLITDAGLLSEWCEATAYAQRNANLRSIATATENWRRTLAGQWRYGARPSSWRPRPLDVVVEGRLNSLMAIPWRHEAAVAELDAWVPDRADGRPMLELIASTSRGALRAAAREEDPFAAAGALVRYRVPAAFVPALAILAFERPAEHMGAFA